MHDYETIFKQVSDMILKHLYAVTLDVLFHDDEAPDINLSGDSPLGYDIAILCDAANGEIDKKSPEFDTGLISDVMDAIDNVLRVLHLAPLTETYKASDDFWRMEIGQVILEADMWWRGDSLITLSEAAQMLRGGTDKKDLNFVRRLIKQGQLTRYADASEPNPQRAGRVRLQQVESLK